MDLTLDVVELSSWGSCVFLPGGLVEGVGGFVGALVGSGWFVARLVCCNVAEVVVGLDLRFEVRSGSGCCWGLLGVRGLCQFGVHWVLC